MCGIAGKLQRDPESVVQRGEIEAMLAPIAHRGPDGQGIHLDGPAGLGHLRLAIIDLSTGDQPMTNEDGSVWLVYNGEIYNYQSLARDLAARGHVFRSRSDTETIIHLYEEYGVDCVRHLRGMFAFAIWDAKRRRLFIARDRVGIKPLYYARTPGAFLFASELKAILAEPGFPREVSPQALRRFLAFTYLPGEDTLFRGIHKLPPGHTLVAEGDRTEIRRYWDLGFNDTRHGLSFSEATEELHSLLAATVRDHMIADVPVGVLLSGGVDSTAVLSYAVQGTAKKVQTFTVGFDGNGVVDERPYARLAADAFGTEHREITISAADFWEFLPSYVRHMEEPVCEPPAVALYYVSRLARQHVKVVLSGEGGDEAFAGYPNYPHMLRMERIQRLLGPLARPAGAVAGRVGALLDRPGVQRYAHTLGRPLAGHYFSRRSHPQTVFNRHAERFLTREFRAASGGDAPHAYMARLLEPVQGRPLLDQLLYADTKTWLPDDLLIKADKITMANSLELRVPLLDHEVLEFAASLPAEYKVHDRDTKRILKAAFCRTLPGAIINRPKAGFPVPVDAWLRRELAGPVRDLLLSDSARSRGYWETPAIERLLARHRENGGLPLEVFGLIAVELWHREFIDRR